MYLQRHLGAEVAALEFGMDGNHGNLDDVGSGALQRCVDGVALVEAAAHGVARVDVAQVALAPEEGGYVAVGTSLLDDAIHVRLHAGVRLEVAID